MTRARDAAARCRPQPVRAKGIVSLQDLDIVQVLFKFERDSAQILHESFWIESREKRLPH
jgi:hypothetical protein